MEKTMKDYIIDEYERYKSCALQFDDERFTNDVLKSFIDAKTYRHYVLLVSCDLNEYYSSEEHSVFERCGYYQQIFNDNYSNRFFIPSETISKAVDILKNEKMKIDVTNINNAVTYVVTINGINDSYFKQEFSNNQ